MSINKVLCMSWGVDWSKIAKSDYINDVREEDPEIANVIEDLDKMSIKKIWLVSPKVESCDL